MDAHIRRLAARQDDIVAAWQLGDAGFSRDMVKHRVVAHGWRSVHPGVYALGYAPLTRRQRWVAAALTTRESVLSHASAGACWGFRPFEGGFETITRPGVGGPRRLGTLLVLRSRTLDGDTTRHDSIPITTAARTLIDLAADLPPSATARAFREALRLKATTPAQVRDALARHRGRRGTALVRELVERYGALPYPRARSDAESRALEVLRYAGIEPPRLNVRIAGEEADLVWPQRRLIVEIDGPQYHRFKHEDERKQRRWEEAGFAVCRISSGDVYDAPARLLALLR